VIRKRLTKRVFPGVRLTLANPLRCKRELMREDFPTFDRPMKATSGRSLFRNCSGPAQLLINSAVRILNGNPHRQEARGERRMHGSYQPPSLAPFIRIELWRSQPHDPDPA